MGSGLFIQMFGPMGFTVSGRPVTTKLSAKSLAILGFLLCSEQHRASREKLASMLWSESYDTATYNLRYNLWNIKKVIPADENGQEFLLASKDACYINPDYQYASDLKRLEALLAVPRDQASREQLSEMKFILERELMEEFYIRDSSDFNDWLLFERTRYQKLSQQVLERLLDSYAAVQDRDGVRQTLEDLLRISPYEEEYYCRMMRLCLEQGDRPAAIQYYQKCEDLLRKDLNLPPLQAAAGAVSGAGRPGWGRQLRPSAASEFKSVPSGLARGAGGARLCAGGGDCRGVRRLRAVCHQPAAQNFSGGSVLHPASSDSGLGTERGVPPGVPGAAAELPVRLFQPAGPLLPHFHSD